MIIGIDASRANRDKKTGVEWYSYYIIQELKKIIPDNVGVFLYTDKKLRGESAFAKASADRLAQMPPNWQEKVLRWPLKYLWTQLRLSLEMLINPPDVLFVPAAALPIICPKKSFTTIHDIGFKKFPKCYGMFQRIYLDWSTRFALKKAVKIFVPSEFTKKELIECYGADLSRRSHEVAKADENKIVVTPLGFAPGKAGEGSIKIDGEYLIFVGRLTEKKNVSRIIEAFELFKTENPDSKLKLVLVGPEGDAKAKIKDDIVRLDYLASSEIADLLKNSRALVFPSLYEGFGLPILEAFAAEVPVITSKGISTEEVARLRSDLVGTSARQADYAAILVNPLSTTEIKDAIFKIIFDENLRQSLIQKGLERVKDFAWEKTARVTLKNILESCL